MSKYVFGIDLGTTYSCIARVDDTARAEVIKNNDGDNITPSVVAFEGDNVIVGADAKAEAVLNPETTVMLVKTLMGKTDFAINYEGEDKTPEEISAFILRKLTQDASEQLGVEVRDVVITCPAYFGTAERTATKNAGKIAGLNVLEIISEPTAAALYYGCAKEQDEKIILVYDLGGGTFDVTIMRISADKIEVICSDGDHDLGGKNWDEVLIGYLADQFVEKIGYDIEFDEYAKQDLRLKAEKIKKQLTSRSQAGDMLEVMGNREKVTVTRDEFDKITSALLNETLKKTKEAIEVAKNKGYDVIDEILLVGGSTRMPQVKKALAKNFGEIEIKILEPDEAVAKGAAIHAVNVYVNNQKSLTAKDFESNEEVKVTVNGNEKELKAQDYKENLTFSPEMMSIGGNTREIVIATTKSFAVKVENREGIKSCFNMIIKNEAMPSGFLEVSGNFSTLYDNQATVDIEIYENDYMDKYFEVDEDLKIGNAILELPKNTPAGSPVEITLKLNKEGILEVKGLDKTGNKQVNVTFETKGVMTKEELERLTQKSQGIAVL
ncbi:Hsp70 family protein [Leptotrichia sp. oral taxon 223]|uniref:Hsp70 family protein n=1 Tax=Leptotrichia sp. oral taxon 223 TaxID=712363 RepID=UPI0015C11604|nr:Hsp70 family protein [Leptotrichia sp. oral taxon 223]NWO20232.1 Hsp70 family protein [Leptotrichia sp. oral taxon 223]